MNPFECFPSVLPRMCCLGELRSDTQTRLCSPFTRLILCRVTVVGNTGTHCSFMHPLNDWVVNWRRIFIYECQCCVLVLFNFDCQHSHKQLRNYNILKFCTLRLFHRPKKKMHSIKCTYVFQNLDYAYSACKHAAAIRI